MDNSLYAIKKLKIKIKNKNKDFENEILKVSQEIRFLAKIKGEFIVDYNHSWVEVNLKDEKNKERKKTFLLTEKDLDFKDCEINDFQQQEETIDDIIFNEAENSHNLKNCKTKNNKNSNNTNNNYNYKDDYNAKDRKSKNKNNKNSSNCFLNFYPENQNLERNSISNCNSNNDKSEGNTKTDSSRENSVGSSSKNISFDENRLSNKNSLSDLCRFKHKNEIKSKNNFLDCSDDENTYDNNIDKKIYKKFSMNLPPSFEKENIKKKFSQRKSTICIKNKEYL